MKKPKLNSEFFKSSSWSFTAVAFRALGGLTINKLFSVYLGSAGLTLLSHFQNLTSLFTLLPSEGVNRSLMKYWADPKTSEEDRKKLFRTGLWVSTSIFIIVLSLLYFWQKEFFFDRFIQEYTPFEFLRIFIPAMFIMILSGYLNSIILSLRRVRAYALINISGLLLLVGVVYLGITKGTLDQALLSFIIGYALMFFCALFYLIFNRSWIKLSVGAPDIASVKKIGKFLAMAISAIVFGRLLDFVVRDYVIEIYGLEKTGIWQSVVKMSTSYMIILTGTVGVVYYPKMASLIHDKIQLRAYVLKVMGFVAFVSILALGVYYLNKEFFLTLFFSAEFKQAGYLVKYQVFGDFFAILSYLLAYLLSARVETMRYIAAQVVSAVIYVSLISILIQPMDLEALTMAYMWRYIGFFLILILFNRKFLFR